ncbi:hypothetical protein M434DRAFT_383972 [Hypoxylon sp. CO27-5]|nr:hypothetical protein M434DRAFT_383972 [Hypoxylon sp. CO27-5]
MANTYSEAILDAASAFKSIEVDHQNLSSMEKEKLEEHIKKIKENILDFVKAMRDSWYNYSLDKIHELDGFQREAEEQLIFLQEKEEDGGEGEGEGEEEYGEEENGEGQKEKKGGEP